jgi:hypothetical protein
MKSADRRGKIEGRKRRTAEVMPGPTVWNKQLMGLAVVAMEAEICRLRPEALPRGSLSGKRYRLCGCIWDIPRTKDRFLEGLLIERFPL